MKKRTKRVIFGVIGVVVLLVGVPFTALMITWAGDSPIKDGEALGTHGKQIKDGFVSAAVIDIGNGGIALVDCGNDKEAKAIVAELDRRKLAADAVKAVLVTHGHGDHLNGCAKFPKAEIYAMAAEKDLIEGRAKPQGPMTKFFGAHDSGVRVTHDLTDGQTFTLGDLPITAYLLVGHTQGSAVYFVDGVLYFGDGASANKDGLVTPAKYLFSDSQKQDIESLKALATKLEPHAAEIKTLEFAHTGTLAGFDPLRAFAKSH